MIVGGLVAAVLGVAAENKSLEDVATPLSMRRPGTRAEGAAGPDPVVPAPPEPRSTSAGGGPRLASFPIVTNRRRRSGHPCQPPPSPVVFQEHLRGDGEGRAWTSCSRRRGPTPSRCGPSAPTRCRSPAAPTSWSISTSTVAVPGPCSTSAGCPSCGSGRPRTAGSGSVRACPTPGSSTTLVRSCPGWPWPPAPSAPRRSAIRGTVGGNLGSASPAGDAHPPLLAAGRRRRGRVGRPRHPAHPGGGVLHRGEAQRAGRRTS